MTPDATDGRLAAAGAFMMALVAAFMLSLAPVSADERPANFVFLVDVSGSMLYKSEMVTANDGTRVTLFEALRQALKQIVDDHRILGGKSKVCVVTFGTQISEKSDWPQVLDTEEKRQKLVQLIESPAALQADKHGDTYMGGALAAGLAKANEFYQAGDPCTTTYLVMLTDGWDEPPHGATVKVADAAARYVAAVKEIQAKVGAKTWQALVVGLQNLPDQKAGTTTARQLAGMLDGQFIDVTRQAGGTVSQKIFLSLKQIVESLKGELRVGSRLPGSSLASGVLAFGTADGNGTASAAIPIESRSCYTEEVTGVREVTGELNQTAKQQLLGRISSSVSYELVSTLPPGAISLKLARDRYSLVPQLDGEGRRKPVIQPLSLLAQVHNNCPAGHFAGMLMLDASAKLPSSIPFSISVPGRLVSGHERIAVLVKKPGLFYTEATSAVLENSLKESAGEHSQAVYQITVTPESANLVTAGSSTGKNNDNRAVPRIDAAQINGGKPFTFTLDTRRDRQQLMRLDLAVPADQVPGRYLGKLALSMTGATEIVAPSELEYEVVVEPSPWERVAPIAIPMFVLLAVTCLLWFFFWLKTLRR